MTLRGSFGETTELYLPGFFQRTSISASPGVASDTKLGKLFMELWDDTGRLQHANRPYSILGPASFAGTTDGFGRLRHEFVTPGDYVLTLPLKDGGANSAALVLEAVDVLPQVRLLGEVKIVTLARLIGLFFDTSKCFLLPAAIPAIARVKGLYDENSGSKLLVFGHTDTAGSAAGNDVLSLERANAIVAYLTDNADVWNAFYDPIKLAEKRWGDKEDRDMVSRLSDADTRLASEAPMAFFRRTRNLFSSPLKDVRLALIKEYISHARRLSDATGIFIVADNNDPVSPSIRLVTRDLQNATVNPSQTVKFTPEEVAGKARFGMLNVDSRNPPKSGIVFGERLEAARGLKLKDFVNRFLVGEILDPNAAGNGSIHQWATVGGLGGGGASPRNGFKGFFQICLEAGDLPK